VYRGRCLSEAALTTVLDLALASRAERAKRHGRLDEYAAGVREERDDR
jgi:hypothetical protein